MRPVFCDSSHLGHSICSEFLLLQLGQVSPVSIGETSKSWLQPTWWSCFFFFNFRFLCWNKMFLVCSCDQCLVETFQVTFSSNTISSSTRSQSSSVTSSDAAPSNGWVGNGGWIPFFQMFQITGDFSGLFKSTVTKFTGDFFGLRKQLWLWNTYVKLKIIWWFFDTLWLETTKKGSFKWMLSLLSPMGSTHWR